MGCIAPRGRGAPLSGHPLRLTFTITGVTGGKQLGGEKNPTPFLETGWADEEGVRANKVVYKRGPHV